jgi:hypothetical protein
VLGHRSVATRGDTDRFEATGQDRQAMSTIFVSATNEAPTG